MKLKLMAVAIATALALPAYAAGDKAKDASASQGATTGNAGADSMFKSMDKNQDGMVTRGEAKGTPHEKDFAKLDKNSDGKLSPQEHATAPEHAKDKAAAGGTAAEPKAQTKTEGKTEGKTKY